MKAQRDLELCADVTASVLSFSPDLLLWYCLHVGHHVPTQGWGFLKHHAWKASCVGDVDKDEGAGSCSRIHWGWSFPQLVAESGVGRDLDTQSGVCYKITAVPSQSGREATLLWLYFWCWTDVEMMSGCLGCSWSFSKQRVSSPPPCKQQLVVALPSVLGPKRLIIHHGLQLLQNHWMWKVAPK